MEQPRLHNKIHLNSEDIRYIKNQLNHSIKSRIDLDLPDNEDDSLRNQVLSYIQQFIDESFELAKHSLIVDGKDMSGVPSLEASLTEGKQEIEPFDIELNEKLRQLYAKVDQETLKVTELRRNIAQIATSEYQQRADAETRLVDSILDSVRQTPGDPGTQRGQFALNSSETEILLRTQEEYKKATSNLVALQEKTPNTVAELSKLAESIRYLQEEL
ncbi:MIND complex subunit NSL1 [Sugiyamaella lignohabitans]|uniref:MIND complex subunit NSL1 n=1 Tax=Sugiyamaella lignohabitans TaxID=796027 RepID=A0A167FZ03_9ASCO|nr:MIND complex subunit NSL1 [Sugiyamaella lignohabitans]ANB15885.1 MIND complex subunit NSL1 [Sugiyamaella lignohabitans]